MEQGMREGCGQTSKGCYLFGGRATTSSMPGSPPPVSTSSQQSFSSVTRCTATSGSPTCETSYTSLVYGSSGRLAVFCTPAIDTTRSKLRGLIPQDKKWDDMELFFDKVFIGKAPSKIKEYHKQLFSRHGMLRWQLHPQHPQQGRVNRVFRGRFRPDSSRINLNAEDVHAILYGD